jgi:hypothetical protein
MQVHKLVALTTEALVESRTQIRCDRESLIESVKRPDGTIDDEEQGHVDAYDRVLDLIEDALDAAKGNAD